MSAKRPCSFSDNLLFWFSHAMRPLPWRRDYEPYAVWISEIMLQQTQMERGVKYFEKWMRLFPTVRAVAEASEDSILAAWEGLGYYSRARNLHKAARTIVSDHGGAFPSTLEDIRALPGVGPYTAAAIASIAFNVPVPAVDANVLRIFSRVLDLDAPVTGKEVNAAVTDAVKELLPVDSPRLFNQALMELGALICGKTPGCDACPVSGFCLALERGTVGERPVKLEKPAPVFHELAAGVISCGGKVFIRKRPGKGLWAGLWEFPWTHVPRGANPGDVVASLVREETGGPVAGCAKIGVVKHSYTTNRVTLHGYIVDVDKQGREKKGKWVGRDELAGYSFAAGHRKLLEKLGWK